jgi:hypothetical protein
MAIANGGHHWCHWQWSAPTAPLGGITIVIGTIGSPLVPFFITNGR